MTTDSIIRKLRSPEIRSVFARNHVRHAYLTGSFARGDAKEASDLDIIYEKESGAPFTLFNVGDIKSSLEEAFGREVDLISESAIRKEIRENVLQDKKSVF